MVEHESWSEEEDAYTIDRVWLQFRAVLCLATEDIGYVGRNIVI